MSLGESSLQQWFLRLLDMHYPNLAGYQAKGLGSWKGPSCPRFVLASGIINPSQPASTKLLIDLTENWQQAGANNKIS